MLAVLQRLVGVWALLGPESFYQNFPGAGHAWVTLLPEYTTSTSPGTSAR